jgi:hypothetical protein
MVEKEVAISEALGYTPGLVCTCGSNKVISWSDFPLSGLNREWSYTVLCDTCGRKTGPYVIADRASEYTENIKSLWRG